MAPATIHLRPTAPIAPRALLPGDPGRALQLARALLEQPRMCNHHRGLWGYTGTAPDGLPATIQSTGMGGPSAAIVLSELIELGVRAAVRVGTCGALRGGLALGDLVVARAAIAADGTSRALGASPTVACDATLTDALVAEARSLAPAGLHEGTIVSTDLFYDPDPDRPSAWIAAGVLAVEMEAATLCTLGARHGVAIGCLLTVSDLLGPHGERMRIDDDSLAASAEAMGAIALAALA